MALGEVDYGLMGVVGGLTAFVTFFNGVMASGVGRFYAYSVGESKRDPVGGLKKCREWFSIAVIIHTIVPVFLIVVGYPFGEWAVQNFLTIPADRVVACVWVWRCTCISCFVGMVSVPFVAMYGAKQEIAEQTVYGFVTSTLNVFFLYYAITNPRSWLVPFAIWSCCLSVVPRIIMSLRSLQKYGECRFVFPRGKIRMMAKQMLSFSGWFMIGNLAHLLSIQGVSIVINKFFGPAVNAAQAISNTVSSHCNTLSGSLTGALWPAITNMYGAKEMDKMRSFVYRACRLGPMLIMLFALPLSLEIDEVLKLWLVNPPRFTAGLCLISMIYAVVDMSSMGYAIAVHASGNVSRYQMAVGGFNLLTLPAALFVAYLGFNVYWIMIAVACLRFVMGLIRIKYARRIVGLSGLYWVRRVFLPILLVGCISILSGVLVRSFLPPSFLRVCITTGATEMCFLPMACFSLLSAEERFYIKNKFTYFRKRVAHD